MNFLIVTNNIVVDSATIETISLNFRKFYRTSNGDTTLFICIDGMSPSPQVGWTYDSNAHTFSA